MTSRPGDEQARFPWPPPEPSGALVLHKPQSSASEVTTIRDGADWMAAALARSGYRDLRWYAVPGGVLALTRLEPIDHRGERVTTTAASACSFPDRPFFSPQFWDELLNGRTARCRMFAFVITDASVTFGPRATEPGNTELWRRGSIGIPPSASRSPLTPQHECLALVYEFRREEPESATLVENGASPEEHLKRARILEQFDRRDPISLATTRTR